MLPTKTLIFASYGIVLPYLRPLFLHFIFKFIKITIQKSKILVHLHFLVFETNYSKTNNIKVLTITLKLINLYCNTFNMTLKICMKYLRKS